MKNIIKILFLTLTLAFFTGCDQGDGRFGDNDSSTGWVEFRSAATTTDQAPVSVQIPLSINVPVYREGLNISYTLTAVEGDYTQFINATGGVAFADPSDVTRSVVIDLPIQNGDLGRDFITIFDVTLTSVDADGVRIGVDNNSIITHRVTLPCSNPAVVSDTYFVGDYSIVDTMATIGPGNGTENFEAGTVTLEVDPMNPNRRNFSVGILPAFTGGADFDVFIEFTTDNVVQLGEVGSGLSCNGADEYSYGPAAIADSAVWDICNDQTITVTYTEDINSSCTGPFPASFTLTKL